MDIVRGRTIQGARQGKARADKQIPASSNEGGGGLRLVANTV